VLVDNMHKVTEHLSPPFSGMESAWPICRGTPHAKALGWFPVQSAADRTRISYLASRALLRGDRPCVSRVKTHLEIATDQAFHFEFQRSRERD
jgi:hypothetical protein